MSVPTLPKGKVAILVMDCQNDIVHEQGKFGGALTGGAMPRTIKERNILGKIKKLMVAGRAAKVPVIHVRHTYRPDYADLPSNVGVFQAIKKAQAAKVRVFHDGTCRPELVKVWTQILGKLGPDAKDKQWFGDIRKAHLSP
jgi:nicotinamidase-related amidase